MKNIINFVFIWLAALSLVASDVDLRGKRRGIKRVAKTLQIPKEEIDNEFEEIINHCEEEYEDDDEDDEYYDCLCEEYEDYLRELRKQQSSKGSILEQEEKVLKGIIGMVIVFNNTSTLNGGPFTVQGGLRINLPEGMDLITTSETNIARKKGIVDIDLGFVSARMSKPVAIILEATQPGDFEVEITALSSQFDPNPSNNKLTYAFTVSEPTKQLVYPWVSQNNQFESILVANNPGPNTAVCEFTALRQSGDGERAIEVIPPYGFLKKSASELFPNMGAGSGSMIFMRTDQEVVSGTWVTNNLNTESGASPSQGVAIEVPMDEVQVKSGSGNEVVFGYLPVTGQFTSAPVVLNIGNGTTDVSMEYFNQAGELLLADTTTLASMEAFRPFATVANSLVPSALGDVYMRASSASNRITGVGFVFNSSNEPGIANVEGLGVTGPYNRILLPWVSKNEQFESIVSINNLGSTTTNINLTATRANGETETVQRTIQAGGFLNETAGALFPTLGDGSGYCVAVAEQSGQNLELTANFVTFNLTTASGTSPSFGNGVPFMQGSGPIAGSTNYGAHINYGFLPVTGNSISSAVLVNVGSLATPATLYFFDEAGNMILKDTTSAIDLTPGVPLAIVANALVPEGSGDVFMVAESNGQPITGVSFVFNTSREPSIGNVQKVDFLPPQ